MYVSFQRHFIHMQTNIHIHRYFPGGSDSKVSAYNVGDGVRSLGQEDPLEKEMAPHSSTLAWKIPRMEEPGRLQSTGSQRVGHNWATSLTHIYIHIYIFFPPLRHVSSGTQYTLLCLCFLDLALYFGELSISIHKDFSSLCLLYSTNIKHPYQSTFVSNLLLWQC